MMCVAKKPPAKPSPAQEAITMRSEAAAKLELWFFRDMLESNRLRLFELFGFKPSEMDTMAKQQMVFRRILDALSTDPEPVKTAPAVAVKALRWRKYGNQHGTGWQGMGAIGYLQYIVDRGPDGEEGWFWGKRGFDTEDEAKAAVQAHYDAAILSALSAQVQDVAGGAVTITATEYAALRGALKPFAKYAGDPSHIKQRAFLQLLICPLGDEHPDNHVPLFQAALAALGINPEGDTLGL